MSRARSEPFTRKPVTRPEVLRSKVIDLRNPVVEPNSSRHSQVSGMAP